MAVKSTNGNSLYFATGVDNDGLKKGITEAGGLVSGLGRTISKINPFAALSASALAAFIAIAKGSYQMMRDYEHAMKEVQTISSAAEKDFDGMSKKIFQVSNLTPDSPEALAKAYYQIASAGYDGAEGINLLKVAAKAAVGGVTDTMTAADGITTVMNAFKISSRDAGKVADIMFQTVKKGKTTFSQLAASISQVASIAAVSGISFEQVSAAIATLTKQGTPTAQAMTQIRAAIQGANKELGDGWGKAMSLQAAFVLLHEKAGGSQVALQKMVGTTEAVSAILGTAGANAKMASEDLEAMTSSVGASEVAFQKMMTSNTNQWDLLSNKIKGVTAGIGDAFLGVSNDFARWANDVWEVEAALTSQSEALKVEQLELEGLVSAIMLTNDNEDIRIKLIDELNLSYPKLLANIDAENVTNLALSKVLILINGQYEKRIDLAAQGEVVAEEDKKSLDLARERLEVAKELGFIDSKIGGKKEGTKKYYEYAEKEGVAEANRLFNQREALQLKAKKLNDKIKKQRKVSLKERAKYEILNAKIDKKVKTRQDLVTPKVEDNTRVSVKKKEPARTESTVEVKTYEEVLQEKKIKYGEYVLAIEQKQEDLAAKLKNKYKLQAEDYETYLREIYSSAKNSSQQIAILQQIDSLGLTLAPDVGVSKETWTYIRKEFTKHISKMAEESSEGVKQRMKDFHLKLETLSRQGLLSERRAIKETMKGIDVSTTHGIKKYEELGDKIKKINEVVSKGLAGTMDQLAAAFGGLGDLFSKFGNEELGEVMGQLSGIASGVSDIYSGDVVGGVSKVITSVVTVDIVSDTSKFEEVMKALSKTIDSLYYSISKSYGADELTTRKESIEELEELRKQAEKAVKAEQEARRRVKFLGITVGKKGSGSGTDQGKIDELKDKATEATRKVVELRQQIAEIGTGAEKSTMLDAIISDLQAGKVAVEDFSDGFEGMMKNALVESFKTNYLKNVSSKFFSQFAKLAGDKDGLTAKDIVKLKADYNSSVKKSLSEMKIINKILSDAGIDSSALGGGAKNEKKGLSGAISTIKEDTAGILSGTLNGIYLLGKESKKIAINSLSFLDKIEHNTSHNKRLVQIERHLKNIADNLS